MSERGRFFEGFFFGTIAGILVGILYAPDSGENTRKKIKKLKDDNENLISQTKECTEKFITKTIDAIEDGFHKVTSYVDKRKSAPNPYYADNDKHTHNGDGQ